MAAAPPPPPSGAALAVLTAGVAAALHVGKLPPALLALQHALGLTLIEAGFLLSLVQGAGMTAGLAFGALADGLGARRSMLLGLLLLALASAAGGGAADASALMLLRAVEGCGFLLVVLPAPGLMRQLVTPQRVNATMGVWGGYMPLATALALLLGPLVISAAGWRVWWWLLAATSAAAALLLWWVVPAADGPRAPAAATSGTWASRLGDTLRSSGPWLVAPTFAMYSGQWLAVVGFLPSLVAAAGAAPAAVGGLTALVAAVNLLGNLAGGRLLQRGVPPPRLLATGFAAMAIGAALAFADGLLPAGARYAAVLLFSGGGGVIPATLFGLALRLAPSPATVSATVGWVQQWSSLGQFAGPPVVAWLASRAGGWQFTGLATAACSAGGLGLTALLAWRLQKP